MSDNSRFWLLDFDLADHTSDLVKDLARLVCVVDEEAGGIIAYATSEYAATLILDSLNDRRGNP